VLLGLVSPSAMMKSYLWVADPRQVTFFARAKKVTKESTPPDGATPSLRFSPVPARTPTRRAHTTRLGLDTGCATTPGPAAMLGRAIRGGKAHPCQGLRWVEIPCREPSTEQGRGLLSEPLFESSRVVKRPTSWRAPGRCEARREPRVFRAVSDPGVLSLGDFSLHEQREVTRPRCGNRNYVFESRA